MKKFISVVLVVAIIALAIYFGPSLVEKIKNGTGTYVEIDKSSVTADGATHEVSVGTTSHKMVENGATAYKILVTPTDKVKFSEAIGELQDLFKQATGIHLQIEEDTGVGHSSSATYISLGETSAFKESGIVADYETLGEQGYQIQTKDKSIFVCGKKSGILYGVYDLLNKLVDYDTYSSLTSYTRTGVTDLNLPDLKIKEVPDIQFRIPVMGAQLNNKKMAHRMRYKQLNEVIVPGGEQHNVLRTIVPYEEHKLTHPKWFSTDQTQLCYSARGDETEYELMVEEAVTNVKNLLDSNPEQVALSITQMDVQTWCECSVCQGYEDYYGTNAASQIFFVNDVAERVEEWLNTERDGREVQFMFFAYHMSEKAPARQKEDGTWERIDDKVKLRENVSVWIAPIYEDYTLSVTHEDSINIRMMLDSWHTVADSYFVWAYNVYFREYLIPYDSYSAIQDLVKYFVSHGSKFLWAQGNWNLRQNTGYDQLKSYLFSKLLWNCNLDVNKLIADYFDKVYYEASDIMEETFWTYRAHAQLQKELGRSGNIYTAPKEEKYWPKRYLVNQLDKMEEAKTAIEKYKTADPALYQNIYDAIVCETISLRYLMLELYSNTFDAQSLSQFRKDFKYDTNRLDFNQIAETESMDGYIE